MTLAVTAEAANADDPVKEDMVETAWRKKISQVSPRRRTGDACRRAAPAVRVKLNSSYRRARSDQRNYPYQITGANVNSAKGGLDGPERAVTLSA